MAQSQVPLALQHHLEALAEMAENETLEEDLIERYAYYLDNPININDTNSDALRELFFLSAFQRAALRAYIQQHGELLSIHELHYINGFDTSTLELLLPIVIAEHVKENIRITPQELLHHGRSNIAMGSRSVIENARGYQENIYEGNKLRYYFRYRYNYQDRIQLQLSGDKDPGEAFFHGSQRQGFDFYGGHLMLNNFGRIKRAVIGQYQLQFGQGLTLWSGYAPYGSLTAEIARFPQGIRPASAFAEYGYLQGAATTIALAPQWSLTAFYSYTQRDATASKTDSFAIQSISQSGYHRTPSEIAKKDAVNEQLYGAHLAYQRNTLRIGATAYHTFWDKTIIPAETPYNSNYFRGNQLSNVGIDFTWRIRQLLLFGETAYASIHGAATIMGLHLYANSNHRFSLSYHNYGKNYHSPYASPIGVGSRISQQQGFRLAYQANLPYNIQLTMSSEFHSYPNLRYGVYAPSYENEHRIFISLPVAKHSRLFLRYRYTEQPQNTYGRLYAIEETLRHQLHASLECQADNIRLITKVSLCNFQSEQEDAQFGLILCQDATANFNTLPLSITARLALFDVDGYDSRLYLAESGFVYDQETPSFQGQGMRSYLIVRYEPMQQLSIGFKYSITQYSDRTAVGSGYERIEAPHRQQWRVQLRWKFPHKPKSFIRN